MRVPAWPLNGPLMAGALSCLSAVCRCMPAGFCLVNLHAKEVLVLETAPCLEVWLLC